MRVAVFSTKPYDQTFLDEANGPHSHDLRYLEARLSESTAPLAADCQAVCAFVNDDLSDRVLKLLHDLGVKAITLRCAGFNNVDLPEAQELGIPVARVPAYSPHAVAEHTLALILALNRRICRAYNRVREGNFALNGLLGFDLFGKTAGVVGTGQIGTCVARILKGFGCEVLAYDLQPSQESRDLGVDYVSLDDLFARSDVITLHCPLTPETRHLIDAGSVSRMKPGVMLINTGRGALIDTQAVVDGLKSSRIGYLGLDVYEEEARLFFEDRSGHVMQDDLFARLLTFPNVLVTGHQAFFTTEALQAIARTTIENLNALAGQGVCTNLVPGSRSI